MTEHDVPTVACATLWLDTSNETSTRPSECLEDCATLAFEAARGADPRRHGAAPAPRRSRRRPRCSIARS